uniref:Uncharacterized protein LOC117355582 n=1 Tax=Geotrypetes seraphini TaxID=260995 RepID=A0A6P8Q4X3_GEOSA|nr:uncharacterized protein LOC117355582 [Geotrypetes seraphini]XP_033790231.1 uncharacterized protein LOC117355582 [Geotrypetes seraphini]
MLHSVPWSTMHKCSLQSQQLKPATVYILLLLLVSLTFSSVQSRPLNRQIDNRTEEEEASALASDRKEAGRSHTAQCREKECQVVWANDEKEAESADPHWLKRRSAGGREKAETKLKTSFSADDIIRCHRGDTISDHKSIGELLPSWDPAQSPEIDPFWYVGRGVRPIGRFGKRQSKNISSMHHGVISLELILNALREQEALDVD